MHVKFCYMIPPLSGLLGLPKHRWRLANKTPYLSSVFTMYCSFQTIRICDLKSMVIISMYEWKVPQNYWGVCLNLNGPLEYCRAVERQTPWPVGKVPYKRGGLVGTSSIHVGMSTVVLGCPHNSSSLPSSTPPPPWNIITSLLLFCHHLRLHLLRLLLPCCPCGYSVHLSHLYLIFLCLLLLFTISFSLTSSSLSPLPCPRMAIPTATTIDPSRTTQFFWHCLQLHRLCLPNCCETIVIMVGRVKLASSYWLLLLHWNRCCCHRHHLLPL